ncbi:hypothetical protein BDV93DRAFT_271684 [Ceratobasidium sp. AG-I]|nr:hypothetical protein BDV93DRAFT_271684 [Ceratobasidium sp. AG-I]
MLGQQPVRSPNAYSAHTRLLSVASLVRIWLEEVYGARLKSRSNCTPRNSVSHEVPPVRHLIAPRRALLNVYDTRRHYMQREDKRFCSGSLGAGSRRSHLSSTNRLARSLEFLFHGAVPARASWALAGASFPRRTYSDGARKPPQQSHPSTPPHDPDRNDAEAERVDPERKFHEFGTSSRHMKVTPRKGPRESTLNANSSTSTTGIIRDPHDPYPESLAHGTDHEVSQDLPPIVQQFVHLDYATLSNDHAWSLWQEIASKDLTLRIPTHFVTRFAEALANAIQGSLRPPNRGDSDPRVYRLDFVLNHLSTSRTNSGDSAKVRLASLRVQRALFRGADSVSLARDELNTLLTLEYLGAPIFLAAVYQAVRLIVQAQANLSIMAEMLVDYWDFVFPVLVGQTRFNDRSPGAFHQASFLRDEVWKVLSSETRLWPWLSDRFSTWERVRGERLALLVLAYVTERKLGPETVNTYSMISRLGAAVPPRLLQQTVEVLINDCQYAVALTALGADAQNHSGRKTHYRLRMRLAAAMGDAEMAEDVYRLMSQLQFADRIDRLFLLQAYSVQGDAERAVARFNDMFPPTPGQPSTRPDKLHFSAVINAHARSGDATGASEWLKRMAKSGFPPDRAIYNSILRSFAMRNDVASVAGVLKNMKKSGIEQDIRTTTILVSMYARRGDPASAEQIVRNALAMPGFVPDRKLLNSLLSAHINAASWQGVIRVFDWMVSMNSPRLRPEIDTMNNVLKAYVYMGAPYSTVSRAFAKLKDFGLRPNARSYLMLIQSACDIGHMDTAWEAFNELEATATKRYTPVNAYILTLIMGGYLRSGDKLRAKTIYEEMQARGIQPTAVSFRVILSAYSNERTAESLDAAEKFMASLLESSPQEGEGWRKATTVRGDPIMTVFAPLLVAHGRSLQPAEVEAKFRSMLELGAQPTIESFTLLMDAYRRVGNTDAVIEVWEQLYKFAVKDHHAQIEPNQKSGTSAPVSATERRSGVLSIALSIYVDAMSQAGRHQDIARTWQMARKDGFSFDSHNWNHLAVALVRAGEPERAFEVVERVLIPYSQYTDRAVRARNRESPTLFTEDELEKTNKKESQVTAVKPRDRPRVMHALSQRGVDSMLEEEEIDPTDMIQSLHILHQLSPTQNLWTPHERTLVELATAARQLKRGFLVTPRGPAGQEPTPIEETHTDAAYAVLDHIKQESPNALFASLVALTKMRNSAYEDRDESFTSD